MADIFNMADTWNAGGTTFTAIRMNVTDTASGATSKLLDLLVGGSSRFSVAKGGNVSTAGSYLLGSDNGSYYWGAALDIALSRDAAAVLAQRNGTVAQTFRWYHTFTNSSNRQNGALKTAASYIEIAAETAGTGADDLDVLLTPAGAGNVRFGAHSAIGGESVTGYITIKDAGGTTRKIAVVS